MKIAGVQCDIQIGQISRNVARIKQALAETAKSGAQLTVFPECSVSGYCFRSKEESLRFAETVPGPATNEIAETCRKLQCFTVIGLIERDETDLFNVAVLIGPAGVVSVYRKIHLPFLGVDRFGTPGNRPFAVHPAHHANIGMMICYDASFPESARCLSLLGAELIVLPTNWPPGSECVAESTIPCRALENGVYFIAVNRVGAEGGFRFIGRSQICDPSGRLIHRCDESSEEIFYAEIDPQRARCKHVIRVPGEHEIHRFADRRPEMYGPIVEPHALPRPGRDSGRDSNLDHAQ